MNRAGPLPPQIKTAEPLQSLLADLDRVQQLALTEQRKTAELQHELRTAPQRDQQALAQAMRDGKPAPKTREADKVGQKLAAQQQRAAAATQAVQLVRQDLLAAMREHADTLAAQARAASAAAHQHQLDLLRQLHDAHQECQKADGYAAWLAGTLAGESPHYAPAGKEPVRLQGHYTADRILDAFEDLVTGRAHREAEDLQLAELLQMRKSITGQPMHISDALTEVKALTDQERAELKHADVTTDARPPFGLPSGLVA
jgi:hypothetical protein